MKKIALLIFLGLIFVLNLTPVLAENDKNLVNIYLFHSDVCHYCKEEIKILNELEKKYNNIKIYKYEISTNNNKEKLNEVITKLKLNKVGVPLTIIGDKYFIGYNEEKTKLEFIKTIKYYSNYGYVDKIAQIVSNSNLPTYQIKDNQPSIEEFLNNYGNYDLFIFNTKNLDMETTSILTSILSELNIYNLLILIILAIILLNLKNNKKRLISCFLYISLYLLQNIFYYINIELVNKVIFLLTLNGFVYSILLYIVKNKKVYLVYSIVVLLAILGFYLKINYHYEYLNIFKEMIILNNLGIFEYIIQVILSLITIFFYIVILEYNIYLLFNQLIKYQRKKHIKSN